MINTTELLPVIIYIHGGSFISGYSSEYDFQTVSAIQEHIFVSINYRLGFLGFASLGDSNMMGNVGLWDQRLGLEWVYANIHAFGGDNKKIKIIGESAGAASVTAQVIHEAYLRNNYIGTNNSEYKFHYINGTNTTGLFTQALAQSGSVTAFWGHTRLFKLHVLIKAFHDTMNSLRPDLYNEKTVNTTKLAKTLKAVSVNEILLFQKSVGRILGPAPVAWGDFFGFPEKIKIDKDSGLEFWKYFKDTPG